MVNDFPRTLSLLRQEKRISQRTAAQELGVSQALLSHYENGVREPGLSFVVRAADYYSVSVDFLLGRTMARDGAAILPEELPDMSQARDNTLRGSATALLSKKLMVNSVSMFFDLLGQTGNRPLISEVSFLLNAGFYKVFRLVYHMDKKNSGGVFATPVACFSELCDAQIKLSEGRLRQMAATKDMPEVPDLTMEMLSREYPQLTPSLLAVLHNVSEKIEERG
jgi:transcriptional regulator with XRE-family HTH domain